MPEHLRAFLVVLPLAWAITALLRSSFGTLMPSQAYARRRTAYLLLLGTAFLSPSFWVFAAVATFVVVRVAQTEQNPVALFTLLLFVVPPAAVAIPGLGVVNFLFELDNPRLLSLLILLPLWLTTCRRRDRVVPLWPERFLLCFVIFQAAIFVIRSETITSGLRSVLYLFTDVYLPFAVFSRAIGSSRQMQDVFTTLCVAGVVLSAIAIVETLRHWLLFKPVLANWDVRAGLGYLDRGGYLRAAASTGHSIVLGYVLTLAFCCWMTVRAEVKGVVARLACPVLLLAGLIATFSRGPWLGAAIGLVTYWAASSTARLRATTVLCGLAACAQLFGSDLLKLVPSTLAELDSSTIAYREMLLHNSAKVFWSHPWVGSDEFFQKLADLGMIQGQGIVDVVNTYVQVALSSGGIGLFLFCGVFTSLGWSLWRAFQRRTKHSDSHPEDELDEAQQDLRYESNHFRALLAMLVATCVTIATVSSVALLPWMYWLLAGLATAYLRNLRRRRPTAHAESGGFAPASGAGTRGDSRR
jgi:hypothetical protein